MSETAEHIDHPSEAQYWLIALVLGVLTAAEVATPQLLDGPWSVVVLFVLMGVKFTPSLRSSCTYASTNRCSASSY